MFYKGDFLLPQKDFEKWSVVACDQYTSEPQYWARVDEFVADAPSALRLIYPEVYLGKEDGEKRTANIHKTMGDYLNGDCLQEIKDSYVLVRRTMANGTIRTGLVGLIDLSDYDYTPGVDAEIRATEGTVLERIPPRVKIRSGAPMELSHVLLFVDDPEKTVIEPLIGTGEVLYDFDLMEDGGHIEGRRITDDTAVKAALEKLKQNHPDHPLFCVGDGNHSLATAKALSEVNGYAMVELVNIHDEAIVFEPIHRLVKGTDMNTLKKALVNFYGAGERKIRLTSGGMVEEVGICAKDYELTVSLLQNFLDAYQKESHVEVDYIHEDDTLVMLAKEENTVGLFSESVPKDGFFEAIAREGAFPRKTFSMGLAKEKRFYLEARKL